MTMSAFLVCLPIKDLFTSIRSKTQTEECILYKIGVQVSNEMTVLNEGTHRYY